MKLIAHAINVIMGNATSAVAAGNALQHLITSRNGTTDVSSLPVVIGAEKDQEYLAWLVRVLAKSEDVAWAAYAMEIWIAPDASATMPSEHPDRQDGLMAIIATQWNTIRIVANIDRNTKAVADPSVTVLESKPLPKWAKPFLSNDAAFLVAPTVPH